jgi:hypothetical protein
VVGGKRGRPIPHRIHRSTRRNEGQDALDGRDRSRARRTGRMDAGR